MFRNLISLDHGNWSCQILSLTRTITDNDNLFQVLRILTHQNIYYSLSVNRNFLCSHTYITKY